MKANENRVYDPQRDNLMVFLIHIISHVTHKYADYFPRQKGLRHSKLQLDKKKLARLRQEI